MIASLLIALLFQAADPAERSFRSGEGYASDKTQMDAVVGQSGGHPAPGSSAASLPTSPPVALVCPHDDHALAGPVYLPVMERVTAPRLILLGVAHKAWKWNVKDVLIFDEHIAWDGPMGKIPVDRLLRGELMKALAPEDVLISNEHHAEEHSLEAFVPWLQREDPEAAIVPILVPAMPWERMEELTGRLAAALARIAKSEGWILGRDLQILISNDAVHYGDQGWGGKNHAPYGVGIEGLTKATANDRRLIEAYLTGPIRPGRLKKFLFELVDETDPSLQTYKVTWCGRFAIPFGLEFTRRLAERMGMPDPEGRLLAYSTSVELGQLEVKDLPPTAPSNLHHWVGYAAMAWWMPPSSGGK